MRVIPSSFFHQFSSRYDFQTRLLENGYGTHPSGGSGSSILMSNNRNLVWKIGDDPATAQFADLMSTKPNYIALPRVFMVSPMNSPYSILVMEKLVAFGCDNFWDDWYKNDYVAHEGAPKRDPFNATRTLNFLRSEAKKRKLSLDAKVQNVMLQRTTKQPVLFDPFF